MQDDRRRKIAADSLATPRPRSARKSPLGGAVAPREVAEHQRPTTPQRSPAGERPRRPARQETAEPQRLHKVLAQSGVGSRRQMEEMIAAGRVEVNGQTARVGQPVVPGDRVKVGGKLVRLRFAERLPRLILYHKPEGEIVSRHDPEQRPTVFGSLPRMAAARWVAVGRLDLNTSGLLVLTTSGELANRLMHPRYQLLREYAVRILGDLSEEAQQRLLNGIPLDDGPASFVSLHAAGGEGANRWYRVSLYEGRNREVRRLFEAVGVVVSRLIRVRYGPFFLPPGLRRGQVLELGEGEVKKLLSEYGMAVPPPSRQDAGSSDSSRERRTPPADGRQPSRGDSRRPVFEERPRVKQRHRKTTAAR